MNYLITSPRFFVFWHTTLTLTDNLPCSVLYTIDNPISHLINVSLNITSVRQKDSLNFSDREWVLGSLPQWVLNALEERFLFGNSGSQETNIFPSKDSSEIDYYWW